MSDLNRTSAHSKHTMFDNHNVSHLVKRNRRSELSVTIHNNEIGLSITIHKNEIGLSVKLFRVRSMKISRTNTYS